MTSYNGKQNWGMSNDYVFTTAPVCSVASNFASSKQPVPGSRACSGNAARAAVYRFLHSFPPSVDNWLKTITNITLTYIFEVSDILNILYGYIENMGQPY